MRLVLDAEAVNALLDPRHPAERKVRRAMEAARRLRREVAIATVRPGKDCLIARLAGVADRTAAEQLRNVKLYVARGKLPAIDEPETWYHADLIGLAAVTPDGAALGHVVAVQNFGAGDLLEIAPAAGGPTLLLPFTDAVVPLVDVAGGRVVVNPPREED